MKTKTNLIIQLIDSLIDAKEYKNARLVVINEYNIVLSSMLQEVKFKAVKNLLNYDLVKWTTDLENNDGSNNLQQDTEYNVIKTIVIFVKKVNA
ncbi:MAG: hypothetical protein SPI36_03355 [Candidatus Onthovivens sp.]|nr:hypothetical protein [Candidatus Onthovivens sp.]MDY6058267.1 hypothetical protein [Candidatus Onthovivens sp.]